MNKFNEVLKELRIEKGLSQQQFAQELNVTQPAVAKWESGERIPSLDLLIDIRNYFGCTLDYLVGLED